MNCFLYRDIFIIKQMETTVEEEAAMDHKVRDLRSALELLSKLPGQLMETDVEVDPMADLAGVYRHIGAGGTCMRPTKEGPAMIFHRVKGHPGARHIGAMAERAEASDLHQHRRGPGD